jgi:lysophospholipase L1-like esterase
VWLVRELFGAGDLPFALVDLGENDRFYMHPNPAGAQKIASAVVRALRKAGLRSSN